MTFQERKGLKNTTSSATTGEHDTMGAATDGAKVRESQRQVKKEKRSISLNLEANKYISDIFGPPSRR